MDRDWLFFHLLPASEAGGGRVCFRFQRGGDAGEKARKVYSITKAGEEACESATREVLTHPTPTFPGILLGLANTPLLGPSEVLKVLKTRKTLLEQRRSDVEEKQARQAPLPSFVNAIFSYSIALMKAEERWLIETIEEIEQGMWNIG
jgi:hypothetical protein